MSGGAAWYDITSAFGVSPGKAKQPMTEERAAVTIQKAYKKWLVAYRINKYLGDKPRPAKPSTSSSVVTTKRRTVKSTNDGQVVAVSKSPTKSAIEARVSAMEEERRLMDSMLSVTKSEQESLRHKSDIINTAERSVTTVRKTIIDGVESRKEIAGQGHEFD